MLIGPDKKYTFRNALNKFYQHSEFKKVTRNVRISSSEFADLEHRLYTGELFLNIAFSEGIFQNVSEGISEQQLLLASSPFKKINQINCSVRTKSVRCDNFFNLTLNFLRNFRLRFAKLSRKIQFQRNVKSKRCP